MAEIKRILSIGTKEFLTGIAPSLQYPGGGIFASARGFNVFVNPSEQSNDLGLLQTSAGPTDISGSVVVDTPQAVVARSGHIYFLGSSGHFYDLNRAGSGSSSPAANQITDRRSGTPITSPSNGLITFKPNGGTEYLYYWQQTQIGRWDLSGTYPTGWADNHFTGLQTTTYHPVHPFVGDIYYGNKDRIGKIYDNAGTAANNTNVLDFASDYTITALEDDGTYLIIAFTKNNTAGFKSETRIVFWDTFSPSWSKEYFFNDEYVAALKRIGSTIYAIGSQSVHAFNYSFEPVRVKTIKPNSAFGLANNVERISNAVIWGGAATSSEGYIGSFGNLVPEAPASYHRPWAGLPTDGRGSVLYYDDVDNNTIYVGTLSKLYYYHIQSGGATGRTLRTLAFDLKDVYDIKRIDIIYGLPLYDTDQLGISVSTDGGDSGSDTTWGSAIGTAAGIMRSEVYPATPVQTDNLQLVLTWTSGNAQIRRIDIYGQRISTI
jgi:hypothetical protein